MPAPEEWSSASFAKLQNPAYRPAGFLAMGSQLLEWYRNAARIPQLSLHQAPFVNEPLTFSIHVRLTHAQSRFASFACP